MLRITAVLTAVFFAAGCASLSGSSMSNLKIGMGKNAVTKQIGKPEFVTASLTADGAAQEIWEYTLNEDEYNEAKVWFIFNGSQLVAWGDSKNFTTCDPALVLKNNFLSKEQAAALASEPNK